MPAQQFRKKPVVIEAIPAREAIALAGSDFWALPQWLIDVYENGGPNGGGLVFCPDSVHIPTLEGTMIAFVDDWIIRGVAGEVYPCKPHIFAATYDPVDEITAAFTA